MVKRCSILQYILITINTLVFILLAFGCNDSNEHNEYIEKNIIDSYDDLANAINEANDNEVIYVGDIDFRPVSPDEYLTNKQIEITKSIKIKSGKDEVSVFNNGMFKLMGSKLSGNVINVSFENICFAGNIDTKNIDAYSLPDYGFYSNAIEFYGNVTSNFEKCSFNGYYGTEGSVINVRYGDYTQDSYLSSLYPDQSGCSLELNFNECNISDNYSFYSGGAFYIDGSNNVKLNMKGCSLNDNKSGALAFGTLGGGGIYAKGTSVNISDCIIHNNQCNFCLPNIDVWPGYGVQNELEDNTRGGAMYLLDCSLEMINSIVSNNVGTIGGGIALTNSKASFDGCSFVSNKAKRCESLKDANIKMPCNLGQGGALYIDGGYHKTVSIFNSFICNNEADISYPGVYHYYAGPEVVTENVDYLKLYFCTYLDNKCNTSYDYTNLANRLWIDAPGDMWTDPSFDVKCCLIVDDTFEKDFTRNEYPDANNDFNLFLSTTNAYNNNLKVSYEESCVPSVDFKMVDEYDIPDKVVKMIVGEKYCEVLDNFVVGSNYKTELYSSHISSDTLLYLLVSIGVISIAIIIVFVVKKTKKKENDIDDIIDYVETFDEKQSSIQKYVVVRFTEEQITDFMNNTQEVLLLTNRECEVLRSILLGKKQIEIAEEMYISTSTVKHFYNNIYKKFNVDKKDALFKKVSDYIER